MEKKKTGISYKRLSRESWFELFLCLDEGLSFADTARQLGYHKSSISRALERSGPVNRYERRLPWYEKAKLGYERDWRRKSAKRRKMRIPDVVVRIYIEEKLKAGWTPELISGRIRQDRPGKSVSMETVYQYIYQDNKALIKYLVIAGNRGKRKRTSRKKYRCAIPAAEKRSIEKRSAAHSSREIQGGWELDTIVSRRSHACVLTVIERCSRFRFYLKLPYCRAEAAKLALLRILGRFPPQYLQSLTMDNGPENAMHREIERELGITTYFCHPYAAHERGTVEYANRQCRTRFPKGTDFTTVNQQELEQVAYYFNNRPMKCLGFRTPYEVFLPALQEAKLAA